MRYERTATPTRFGSRPALAPVFEWARHAHLRPREHRHAYGELEAAQHRFAAVQDGIEGPAYPWPLEPLYEWSRRVEYPFVWRAIQDVAPEGAHLLDAGSGVTFFDVFLAGKPGMRVECLDRDPSYPQRMERVCRRLGVTPPRFHVGDLTTRLPFVDSTFDAVLCISVLEHLPEGTMLPALAELWRLVARGGALIFTLDVTLASGGEGLAVGEVPAFARALADLVGPLPLLPEALPTDLLTPQRPGYGLAPLRVGSRHVRGGLRAWSLRRRRVPLPRFDPLACLLCVAPKPDAR